MWPNLLQIRQFWPETKMEESTNWMPHPKVPPLMGDYPKQLWIWVGLIQEFWNCRHLFDSIPPSLLSSTQISNDFFPTFIVLKIHIYFYYHLVPQTNFFNEFFRRIFATNSFSINFLTNFNFSEEFFDYNLLTIANFRIGVPLILFLVKKVGRELLLRYCSCR